MLCSTPFCSIPVASVFAGLLGILINFKIGVSIHRFAQSAVLAGGGCPSSLCCAAVAVPRVSSFLCHLTTFRYVFHPLPRALLLGSCHLLSWHCVININNLKEALAGPDEY